MLSSFSKSLLALAALSGSITAVLSQEAATPTVAEEVPVTPATSTQETFPATPLAQKRFEYPNGIPYRVDTDDHLVRGRQIGYNICNSTTEGQDSMCQTSFVNSIDDFCLWAPPLPDSIVGDVEGGMVAWCTKPGRGTRLIPADTIHGLQFIKTRSYVAIIGYIDQTKINIAAGDWGGEMDPHGADLRGNPVGGLLFSNAFSDDKNNFVQTIEWHTFIGNNKFCFKACDPADPDDHHYCEHIFDRIGCDYNIPNNAQNNTFEACEGENQDFPGTYTLDGQVMTYTQPPESLGAIATIPYPVRIPATSNCVQYQSSQLFVSLPTLSSSGASVTATPSASGLATSRGTSSRTGSATGTAESASETDSNDASTLMISVVSVISAALSSVFLL